MNDKDIILTLSKNIKQYRLKKDLSQEDVAFAMNTSVSVLSKLERGNSCLIETFIKITNALQATPNELLKGLYRFPDSIENVTPDLKNVFVQYNIKSPKAQQAVVDMLSLLGNEE